MLSILFWDVIYKAKTKNIVYGGRVCVCVCVCVCVFGGGGGVLVSMAKPLGGFLILCRRLLEVGQLWLAHNKVTVRNVINWLSAILTHNKVTVHNVINWLSAILTHNKVTYITSLIDQEIAGCPYMLHYGIKHFWSRCSITAADAPAWRGAAGVRPTITEVAHHGPLHYCGCR